MAKSTRGIIFLGTPMQGADLAVFAGGLARALFFMDVNHDILRVLRPDSEKCYDMQRTFHDQITQCRKGGGFHPALSSYYEQFAVAPMSTAVCIIFPPVLVQ